MTQHATRRDFMKLAGAGAMSGLLDPGSQARLVQRTAAEPREESGADLAGWTVVLGDGVYAAPGEPPVTADDIETAHDGTLSELRANIGRRRIMAHNIGNVSHVVEIEGRAVLLVR